MESIFQVTIFEKIYFEVYLTGVVRSIEEKKNKSARTLQENLVDQSIQGKIPIIRSSARKSELVKLSAQNDSRKRKLQSQQNKTISKNETLVQLQSFMKKFPSEPLLKCTVSIGLGVLITSPEKPVAKGITLRTYLARQVFQKLHPQIAIEVEHSFYVD